MPLSLKLSPACSLARTRPFCCGAATMSSSSSRTENPNLEPRSVVSGLLFPPDPYAANPPRLLVFRRSDKVRTYKRKLAPISGSIETYDQSPLAAAWRELGEETRLQPKDVELWRKGAGFRFTDETALSGQDGKGPKKGRIWTVWPFAFRLKRELVEEGGVDGSGVSLKIDWEHLNYEWRTVDEILSGKILDDCVPRLESTLGQVWVDQDSVLYRGLEQLRLDHVRGARELATMAVRSLIEIIQDEQQKDQDLPPERVEDWWKAFRRQAFHLAVNGRPSMGAAISAAVLTALARVRPEVAAGGSGVRDRVKEGLQRYVEERGEVITRVGHRFSEALGDWFGTSNRVIRILTLSSSSTIRSAILHALDNDPTCRVELRILESRPLYEGVSFAKFLTAEAQRRQAGQSTGPSLHDRLHIVLASDASVGILSKDVDLVLIGADRISEAGDVSNKTGSLPAVLTSKAVTDGAARVVCISELDKIAPPGSTEEHGEEDNDRDEVMNGWQLGPDMQNPGSENLWNEVVTVRNVYFEWVPAKYVDAYVCETGLLNRDEIGKQSTRVKDLAEEMFFNS